MGYSHDAAHTVDAAPTHQKPAEKLGGSLATHADLLYASYSASRS
jgi:hypothetical protein